MNRFSFARNRLQHLIKPNIFFVMSHGKSHKSESSWRVESKHPLLQTHTLEKDLAEAIGAGAQVVFRNIFCVSFVCKTKATKRRKVESKREGFWKIIQGMRCHLPPTLHDG
ncbi:CLUMA_CG018545, isoform A [Clunio marinus]|uniref:CLUMA_CG018545, isoform A n=1 Tax=Clunio marinus TaxID=568069 RepID=A0A1J1IXH9_9DIPT|nr:CLUMA_CG018545, isoform A [Clunio marinus]